MIKSNTEKRIWMLGSLMLLALLPILFIIGFALGIYYEGSMSLTQDNLSSWVTAIATVTIAVLTIILAKETWSLRQIQLNQIEQIRKDAIRPSVNFILKSNPASIRFIDVHIINNGNGSAHNIKFKFSGYNNKDIEIYKFLESEFMKLNIFKNGILSLSKGEKRNSHVFDFNTLNSKFGDKTFETIFTVEIKYEDIEGQEFTAKSNFDFSEYIGINELGKEPINDIASTLKNLNKNIEKLASATSSNRIEINTYNAEDREKRAKEMEEYIKSFQEKQKEANEQLDDGRGDRSQS